MEDVRFEERLEDVFARRHICSPRRVRRFLQTKDFRVNGRRVFMRGEKLCLFHDEFSLDGEPFDLKPDVYLVMNKKSSTLCTHQEGEYERVFDVIPEAFMGNEKSGLLHTVGRLDGNTEGLLIFTTNGDFSHSLVDPERHVDKKYFVKLRDKVPESLQNDYVLAFEKGMELPPMWNAGSFFTKPASLEWVSADECLLTISEGKFHQVKRMFLFMGNEVSYLKRVSMGGFSLPSDINPGEFRLMSESEIILVVQKN